VFKLVSFFVIVFALVAVCIVEDVLVTQSLIRVRDYCYQIEKAYEERGSITDGQVAFLVDNLQSCWTSDEGRLCYLVNHKSVEPLGVEIVRLKTYIDEEETTEFFVSLEIIKNYTKTFPHFMGASLHNIL
jgi:hypothetical protein